MSIIIKEGQSTVYSNLSMNQFDPGGYKEVRLIWRAYINYHYIVENRNNYT